MAVLSPIVVALVLAVLVCGGVAFRTRSISDKPGASAFILIMLFAMGWSGTYAVSLLITDVSLRQFIEVVLWIFKTAVPVAWLIFALEYTGRTRFVTRKLLGLLLVAPVVTIVIIATNGTHHLMWEQYRVVTRFGVSVAEYQPGPWLYLQTGYAYLLIGSGTLAIGEMAIADRTLYARQAAAIVAGTLIPTVANLYWLATLRNVGDFDVSPIGFAATGVLFGYALFRYDLFTLTPATWREGHRTAIDDFGDGVVILDGTGRIVNLNDAAEQLLGRRTAEVLEQDVTAVFRTDSIDLDGGKQTVTLGTVSGNREFTVTPSTIVGRHGNGIGYTLVLHDITPEKQRRQRLEVLERVLRHNLRNSLSVVISRAETIQHRPGSDVVEHAHDIESQSKELVALSDKVREIDNFVERSLTPTILSLGNTLRAIRERLAEANPDVQIRVDAADDVELRTDNVVFEELVAYAIDAFVDRTQAGGTVTIAGSLSDDGWTTLAIATDDDGVSVADRDAIARGSETPLKHGHNLDLWLVKWGVETLGGEWRFEDDGRTLVVSFPQMEGGVDAPDGSSEKPDTTVA